METNPFRARGGKADDRESSPAGAGRPGGGRSPGRPSEAGLGHRIRRWVEERVRGQVWWYRLPLLLGMAWLLRGYLTEFQYSSLFSGITLGFHEMGHAFFSWFGVNVLTAAGGTIFQLAVPLGAAVYLAVKQRDPFGATVGTFWLGTALVDAGIYAADALKQELPLVSPFGPVDVLSHDWTVMLMRVGRLSRAEEIGGALQDLGVVVMVLSCLAGAWVLRIMAGAPEDGATPPPLQGEGARLRDFLDEGGR